MLFIGCPQTASSLTRLRHLVPTQQTGPSDQSQQSRKGEVLKDRTLYQTISDSVRKEIMLQCIL